jgi:hypothetical protein
MSSANNKVTPIRSPEAIEREDQLVLAGHLMRQAAQAAILLIEENQPHLAADVLRLARDRWDSVAGGAP